MRTTRTIAIAVVLATLAISACATDRDDAAPADRRAIEVLLSFLAQAERDQNATAFLSAITDSGLESFGEGTRAEIQAGQGGFGQQPPGPVMFVSTKVTGDRATTVADFHNYDGVSRVVFRLIRRNGMWLVDGIDSVEPLPS